MASTTAAAGGTNANDTAAAISIFEDPEKQVDAILDCQEAYNELYKELKPFLRPVLAIANEKSGKMMHDLDENDVDLALGQASNTKPEFDEVCAMLIKGLGPLKEQLKQVENDIDLFSDLTGDADCREAELMLAPIKGKPRVVEKATQKYGGDVRKCCDLARASLVAWSDPAILALMIQRLKRIPFASIRRIKNGFISSKTPGGYRDLKVAVAINGHVCELQLHIKRFLDLKDGAHKVYEWARHFDPDAGMDPSELALMLDPVGSTDGRGSVLFRALDCRAIDLIRCFLMHPRSGEVVNGTPDSWPPFANAIVGGQVQVADLLMAHKDFQFDDVPWQFMSFVLREAPGYSPHPNLDEDVPYEKIRDCVKRWFQGYNKAGHEHPTFDEFMAVLTDENPKARAAEANQEWGDVFDLDDFP